MSFAIGFASWKVFLVGGCLWLLHGGVGVLSRLMESSLLKRESTEISIDPRIIDGGNATPGRFPYYSAINLHFSFVGNVLICGGSLIAPDVVLTASHCWQGPDSDFLVQIGIFDIENPSVEQFSVLHYLPHPLFGVDRYFDKDLMLLILNETSSNTVLKVNRNGNVPHDGQSLLTIGLGTVNNSESGPYPNTLQELEVNEIPQDQCERSTDGNFTFQGLLTDNMVCAWKLNSGPCYKDSGGPLIVQGETPDQDMLIGTVSWDNGCVTPIFPNVYARVSGLIDWIESNVCHYSQNPPADFNCQDKTHSPAPTPVPSKAGSHKRYIPITVQLVFVDDASFTWWFILNDDDELVFIQPRYSYTSTQTEDQRVIQLPVAHSYTFVLKNDGYNNVGRLARFAVRLGSHGNGELLAYSLGGSYDLEERTTFYISNSLTVAPASSAVDTFPPSEAPTPHPTMTPTTTLRPTTTAPSMTPSASIAPTTSAAPTIQTQEVTVLINFKGFASEVGYKILASGNKTIVNVPFGTYGVSRFTAQQVVPLPTGKYYTFVIMDFFGDNVWPGDYALILGPSNREGTKLLSRTGILGFEERFRFYVGSPMETSPSKNGGAVGPSLLSKGQAPLKGGKTKAKTETLAKAKGGSGKKMGKVKNDKSIKKGEYAGSKTGPKRR